jgi:hypothetical protein
MSALVSVNKWQKRQKVSAVAQLPLADLNTVAEIAQIAGIPKTSMEWAFCRMPRRGAQIAEIAQIPEPSRTRIDFRKFR